MTITYAPIYRSPISGRAIQDNSRFTLADLSGAPVVLVQGQVADLLQGRFAGVPAAPWGHPPLGAGDMLRLDEGYLARLTDTQFYFFGATPTAGLPTAAALEAGFRQAGRFAHATDYGGGEQPFYR